MNTRSSSWTQKAPRDLNAAFGPYCGTEFHDDGRDYPTGWWAALIVISLLALIVIGSTL